jgi:dTDP-4-dehydrorhamnose 3,5-epimerase
MRIELAPNESLTKHAAGPLESTLNAATRQPESVTPDGQRVGKGIAGVTRTHARSHVDPRGFLVELFDPRWDWLAEPFAYAYATTVRPGYAKGWGLHKEHSDRYFLLLGEAEVVLYDVRPESETCGQVASYSVTEFDRGHLVIPPLVWHALRNVGTSDVLVVNFPTTAFDHSNPDKYSLPLDTDLIPYSFDGVLGW